MTDNWLIVTTAGGFKRRVRHAAVWSYVRLPKPYMPERTMLYSIISASKDIDVAETVEELDKIFGVEL